MQLDIDIDKLNADPDKKKSIHKFSLTGDLNFSSYQHLSSSVEYYFKKGYLRFIFDFKGLNSIDSIGIGTLINIAKILEKKNGEFIIVQCRENILSVLNPINLEKLIRIFNTVDEGLDYFGT